MLPASITPQRRYGQHFLIEPDVFHRMIRVARLSRADVVLEIGPGIGNLTTLLLGRAGKVIAVEVDRQFTTLLDELASRSPHFEPLWGDALTIDLPAFDKAVASLPYNVSLPIIFRLLEQAFETAVLIVQDRQARRLTTRPGNAGYSRIGVTAQRLASVELLGTVPKDTFLPPPDADGAIISVTPRQRPVAVPSEEYFATVLDALFLHRTRPVGQALRHLVARPRSTPLLDDLPPRLRSTAVQEVGVRDFAMLARALHRHDITIERVPDRVKRRAQQRRGRNV